MTRLSARALFNWVARVGLGALMGVSACSPAPQTADTRVQKAGEPVQYAFGTVDGELLSSQTLSGRVTVLLFGTSYDLVTQAVSKRLNQVLHSHTPRLNVGLVLLEPPENADMARAYRDLLHLDFPIALGDSEPARAAGPFGSVQVIPSWVFLSRSQRVVATAVGDLSLIEIERLIVAAEKER